MRNKLERYWYSATINGLTGLLLPFSWLFSLIVACRRYLYRCGIFKTFYFQVPVVVVGNIAVGGTGKTPCVIWLAHYLRSLGLTPGIVSRGVGGLRQLKPYRVQADTSTTEAGDEAVLLAQQTGCPLVVCIDRVAAVRDLLQHTQCDVVISDDGLQHYRLGRDLEIVLVDGMRRFGNGRLLPAGPLREPLSRLASVDLILVNEGQASDMYTMQMQLHQFVSLKDENTRLLPAEFQYKKVHAVAGIGHPERFFQSLRRLGLELVTHVFPDHYLYQSNDFNFNDDLPIVMTQKDAVKCKKFADERYWFASVNVSVNPAFEQALLTRVQHLRKHHGTEEDFAKRTCQHAGSHQSDRSGQRS